MASTLSEIIKSEKPTFVDFYAGWCKPCKMMHPVLDKLKVDLEETVKILKINADKKFVNRLEKIWSIVSGRT